MNATRIIMELLPKLLTLKILKQKDIKAEWRVRSSVMRVGPAIRVGKSSLNRLPTMSTLGNVRCSGLISEWGSSE
jgi:hypothetical protein